MAKLTQSKDFLPYIREFISEIQPILDRIQSKPILSSEDLGTHFHKQSLNIEQIQPEKNN